MTRPRSRLRTVVFTGDDFGFSHGVNRAIIEAHERGVLTSASLMVTGDAFEEAVNLARSHPRLSVGLHLVVICGKAVLPPSEVPHLVDRTGQFSSVPPRAGLRYQFDWRARRELQREIRAQLEKFRRTGLRLAHVDGHLHMHMHPVVLGILAGLAPEFEIKTVRLPLEELGLALALDPTDAAQKRLWSWVFGQLRRYGEHLLKSKGIDYADRVYGFLTSGRMNEQYLLGLIPRIQADRVEIYSHPAVELEGEPRNGPSGSGPSELAALVSQNVRRALLAHGFLPEGA